MRADAISAIASKSVSNPDNFVPTDVEASFGADTFSLERMRDYLPKGTYKKLLATVSMGDPIDISIADEVANAMKVWALSFGATHYTHWFQPLTGSTAEKHDSFMEPNGLGGMIATFSGKKLAQGEPDASSFPSGGIRQTCEARGYTAWDPTSPAFLKRTANAVTLCIPTAFYSYTGEALDKKIPLLRSIKAISKQAKRVLAAFGEKFEGMVNTTLGAEQEYFLVDKKLYMKRPDLVQTGRTLFGSRPARHQQLEDHYFGAIRSNILDFMADVDKELWRLGIPSATRHNEVAPAQFEVAPIFENLNIAVDHNMMLMEVLRTVANRHGLVCLLHEKPFAGVNGSGKHNNWSLGANGRNLLDPGSTPYDNAIFLTFLAAIMKGVDTYPEMLRAAIASAGNDHRLGANEAPPAILSIFMGEQLLEVIERIEKGTGKSEAKSGVINVGVDTLPELPKDATDRNRTSPFAFTGNRFEFRAVGSQASCAGPNIVLNTIVAEALDIIATELETFTEANFNESLQKLLKKVFTEHKRIVFNGNNYSEEWIEKESVRRGLPNLRNTPEALKAMHNPKVAKVFSKHGVLSEKELESRSEIYIEEYKTKVTIEADLSLDMARTMILPAGVRYQALLANNVATLGEIKVSSGVDVLKKEVEKVGALISNLCAATESLESAIEKSCTASMIEGMTAVRAAVDALEVTVEDSMWPMPKYSELLFMY